MTLLASVLIVRLFLPRLVTQPAPHRRASVLSSPMEGETVRRSTPMEPQNMSMAAGRSNAPERTRVGHPAAAWLSAWERTRR